MSVCVCVCVRDKNRERETFCLGVVVLSCVKR